MNQYGSMLMQYILKRMKNLIKRHGKGMTTQRGYNNTVELHNGQTYLIEISLLTSELEVPELDEEFPDELMYSDFERSDNER